MTQSQNYPPSVETPMPSTPHLPKAEVLAPFEQQEQTYEEYIEEIDLKRYVLILKRRWWVMGVCGVLLMVPATLFALWQQRLPQTYVAYGKLLFQQQDTQSVLTGVGEEVGQLTSISRTPLDTEIALLRSRSVLEETLQDLDWRDPLTGEPLDVGLFNKTLSVNQVPNTDILDIAFESPNPDQSVEAVDALMEAFIRRKGELKRAEVVAARQFIEQQLPQLEAKVNETTSALQAFKQANNLVSLESEAGALAGRLTVLTEQIEGLQTELATADARSQELRRQLGMDADQALNLSFITEDPGIQQVLGSLQTAQSDLTVQRTLYTPDHPIVANLTRQVTALEDLLQQRINALLGDGDNTVQISDLHLGTVKQNLASELVQADISRVGLNSQIQQLAGLQGDYTRRVRQVPALEVTQQRLQDQVNLAQSSYQQLLNRLPELVIAESQSVGSSRVEIIERASAPPSVPPGFQVIYVIAGGVVGGFGGLGLLIFLELIDRSIKTIHDAEARTGHTALGAIAAFTTSGERNLGALVSQEISPRLVVLRSPESPICESYQMILAALRLKGWGNQLRSLAVLSTIGQEGRSEIVANLAATTAQGRRRVLIIDADLRSPSQHLLWKTPNTQGLSTLLDQEEPVTWEDLQTLVQPLTPYLSLLPSGPLPLNPLALLDSQYTMDFIRQVSRWYDCVILDTPPLTRVADGALLGQMVDGALWVMRTQFVDPSLAVVARSLLLKSRTPVVGLVVNQVDFRVEESAYAYLDRQHQERRGGLLDGIVGQGQGQVTPELILDLEPRAEASSAEASSAVAARGGVLDLDGINLDGINLDGINLDGINLDGTGAGVVGNGSHPDPVVPKGTPWSRFWQRVTPRPSPGSAQPLLPDDGGLLPDLRGSQPAGDDDRPSEIGEDTGILPGLGIGIPTPRVQPPQPPGTSSPQSGIPTTVASRRAWAREVSQRRAAQEAATLANATPDSHVPTSVSPEAQGTDPPDSDPPDPDPPDPDPPDLDPQDPDPPDLDPQDPDLQANGMGSQNTKPRLMALNLQNS